MQKQFDSTDSTIAAFGQMITDYKSISYAKKREGQVNHSGSGEPSSYSLGKITYECKFALFMTGNRQLEKIAKELTGVADVTMLPPFPVTVNYFNEDVEEVTDTVTIKILSQGREVTGDMGLAYEYETLCTAIRFAQD